MVGPLAGAALASESCSSSLVGTRAAARRLGARTGEGKKRSQDLKRDGSNADWEESNERGEVSPAYRIADPGTRVPVDVATSAIGQSTQGLVIKVQVDVGKMISFA